MANGKSEKEERDERNDDAWKRYKRSQKKKVKDPDKHRGSVDHMPDNKKKPTKRQSFFEFVNEMRVVGSVERESNQKNHRTDGVQNGPDPAVQRELKNHGILYRTAQMRAGLEKKSKRQHESLDEHRLAKAVGFAAKIACGDKRLGLHQFADAAQSGAEYAVHRSEEMIKSRMKSIRAGARKLVSGGPRHATNEDTINELHGKGSIGDIGKHHSARMTNGAPNSKYHAIMRNRASRLRDMNKGEAGMYGKQPSSTRKERLKNAAKDSKEAKALAPK